MHELADMLDQESGPEERRETDKNYSASDWHAHHNV